LQGTTGAIGSQGAIGSTGSQGAIGTQGTVGATGSQGTVGTTGSQGATGTQGFTGSQGFTGNGGAQGIQGIKGDPGSQGTTGLQGIQGLLGIQGVQGILGFQGVTGIQGTQGIQGIQGLLGSTPTVPGSNNEVLTSNGAGAIVAESNLTFDGSLLTINDRLLTTSSTYPNINTQVGELTTPTGIIAFSWLSDFLAYGNLYSLWYKDIDIAQRYFSNNNTISPTFYYEGDVIEGTYYTGATVDLYSLVSLRTDGTWEMVDQTNVNSTKMLGIYLETISGGTCKILLEGHVQVEDTNNDSAPFVTSLDHGLPIYIKQSTTSGELSTNVPGSKYVRILGHAYHQSIDTTTIWIMRFDPDNTWIDY
jgi:hypothetical protein